MSSAAQPAAAIGVASVPEAKKVPGWKQLQKLIPYLGRYKGQVVLGLITLALMGTAGALQPLTFGVIMDCLSGNARALGQLNDAMPRLAHWITFAYQPSSRRTLLIYCVATLIVTALKGVFLFWMRW